MSKRSKFDLSNATAVIAGYNDPVGNEQVDIAIHIEIDDDDAPQMLFVADIEPAITAIWRERRNEEGCKGVHLHPQGSLPAMTIRMKHPGSKKDADGVDEKAEVVSFHWVGAAITARPVIKVPSHDAFRKGEDGSKIVVVLHTKQKLNDATVSALRRLKGERGTIELFATNPELDEPKANGATQAPAQA